MINSMNVIYDWVNAIINNPDIPDLVITPIIPSHANIPAPSTGQYITIDYAPALHTLGKADWKLEYIEATDKYKMTLRTDYECTVEIWETNGNGSKLFQLINSQWIDEANYYLRENKISFLRNGDIVPIPAIDPEDKWSHESMVEIVFMFGAGVSYETTAIEHVKGNGEITRPDETIKNIPIEYDI